MYDKKSFTVKPSYGKAEKITEPMYGLIEQLVVKPASKDTIWSLDVKDRDGDIVLSIIDHQGIFNDRQGIPIGKDKSESFKFIFNELTSNEDIKVSMTVREGK